MESFFMLSKKLSDNLDPYWWPTEKVTQKLTFPLNASQNPEAEKKKLHWACCYDTIPKFFNDVTSLWFPQRETYFPENTYHCNSQHSKGFFLFFLEFTRCLKITEKVSFNIASEASYVYILSGQKLVKNAKNGTFWRVFENLKLAVKQCYQTGQF